jgi:2-polyprenyl-3-methyl-5-hydroxy-6-metoxy-1,4-benzoquinol methylase
MVERARYEQKIIDEHFDADSGFWTDIYQRKDVLGVIFRRRQTITLNYVKELALPKTARVLEIGCGAGFLSIALAQRGYTVHAVDHAPAMIALTQEHAEQKRVDNRIHATIGDLNNLTFENQSFHLIVALGVVIWLHNLKKALAEIARVLTPGGYVVLSMNNTYGASLLLDPLMTPAFGVIRKWTKRALEKAGLLSPRYVARIYTCSIKEFNQHLSQANLTNITHANIGFGPFTFLGHNVFCDRIGVKVEEKLQQYADNRIPVFRSLGSQYVILGRKAPFADDNTCQFSLPKM